jgi:hypothetical protein
MPPNFFTIPPAWAQASLAIMAHGDSLLGNNHQAMRHGQEIATNDPLDQEILIT